MALPYDYARCHGEAGRKECETCQRRTAPWREFYQAMIQPENETGKECEFLIKEENENEIEPINA